MPTFTPEQTVFTLSMLSNLGHCLSGSVASIEAQLTPILEKQLADLQPQIGDWGLVWGPAVYELPTSNLPDNVMFVARSGGQAGVPGLVVSVAGTNPYSVLDWIVEDFLVRTQVPWLSGGFNLDRKISLGTFIGLSALQLLKPGPQQPGAGNTLREFLATQVGQPVSISVAGHSLGGALSPTLALWLHDTRNEWDPAGRAIVGALPSAGPTAGNQAFAAFSDAQIGNRVTRIHNPLDVVPHAWVTGDLQAIPTLYAPAIQPDDLINAFVALAIDISQDGNYTQINADAPALSGSAVNTSIINPNNPSFVNFFAQLGYQHVDAYYDLIGVPILSAILECTKASALLAGPGDALSRLQTKLAKFQA